ncbi:hypothetical protein JYT60_01960 [bacterium AH-315-C08]|nr:hypothetical protein [bacterium AH-315-C08]
MEVYDNLVPQWVPFLMFFNQSNFCSDIVNTDKNGFRLAGIGGEQRLDKLNKSTPINILIGGSVAFGVGATSDSATIPALLSNKMGQTWMNFGGRANVSTQEWVSFAYHRDMIGEIDNIVIFSGFNDLYLYFASKYFNQKMGSFFFASKYFESMMNDSNFNRLYPRLIINKLLNIKYGNYDFKRLSYKDSIKLLFHKITISQAGLEDFQGDIIQEHREQPSEVVDVLKRNICNWKIFAEHYDAKLIYVLQPFANWLSIRKTTIKERKVFDILDNAPKSNWKSLSAKINGLHGWFSGQLQEVCEKENIDFYDSNAVIDNEKYIDDVFVDRVHLTNFGNQIISDYIVDNI